MTVTAPDGKVYTDSRRAHLFGEQAEGAEPAVAEVDDAAIPEPEAEPAGGEETAANDGDGEIEETNQEEPPPADGGGSPVVVVGVVLVIALGAGYYLKIVRPRKALDNADDLEDIEYLEEDDYLEDYAFEDEEGADGQL